VFLLELLLEESLDLELVLLVFLAFAVLKVPVEQHLLLVLEELSAYLALAILLKELLGL
jgi:hypothetical protein